jgi:hypothetical protein
MLTELARYPSAIEEFVARLVCCLSEIDLINALQVWGEQHVADWSEILEDLQTEQAQQSQLDRSVLLVVVSDSDEAATQSQSGKNYRVKAWWIADSDDYRWSRQGYRALGNGLTGNETYGFEEIADLIKQFLTEASSLSSSLEIHIFLPLAHLNHAVDCWENRDRGLGFVNSLGREYKVVVRSTDRLSDSYNYQRWKAKWQQKRSFDIVR